MLTQLYSIALIMEFIIVLVSKVPSSFGFTSQIDLHFLFLLLQEVTQPPILHIDRPHICLEDSQVFDGCSSQKEEVPSPSWILLPAGSIGDVPRTHVYPN